jgi:hypothetical protein
MPSGIHPKSQDRQRGDRCREQARVDICAAFEAMPGGLNRCVFHLVGDAPRLARRARETFRLLHRRCQEGPPPDQDSRPWSPHARNRYPCAIARPCSAGRPQSWSFRKILARMSHAGWAMLAHIERTGERRAMFQVLACDDARCARGATAGDMLSATTDARRANEDDAQIFVDGPDYD